jgi:uncharacterized membrane protein
MPLAPFIIIALSFIGLADTLYLSYFAYMNLIPSCAIGGCEVVLTSQYSKFFGVPLAYLGLVYYAYLFLLAVLLTIDPKSRVLTGAMALYTIFGLILSAIFEFYIQGHLLGTYCMYCAISAITTLALAITATLVLETRKLARN